MTTSTSPTAAVKCARCDRPGVSLECTECKKPLCNLHFCDVCRHCLSHCKCWGRLSFVYSPRLKEAVSL